MNYNFAFSFTYRQCHWQKNTYTNYSTFCDTKILVALKSNYNKSILARDEEKRGSYDLIAGTGATQKLDRLYYCEVFRECLNISWDKSNVKRHLDHLYVPQNTVEGL